MSALLLTSLQNEGLQRLLSELHVVKLGLSPLGGRKRLFFFFFFREEVCCSCCFNLMRENLLASTIWLSVLIILIWTKLHLVFL